MKSLKLPVPANKLWRETRDTISDLGLAGRAVRTRLGGGTILAARWGHRLSTDIDVQISGTTDLTEIRKGREGDLARRLGGKWALDKRNQVKVRLEDGVINVSTVPTQPNRGAHDVEIDGRAQTVLSTTQILRGKLERADDPGPVRDAYDLATAAKCDPEALTAAVGMLPDEHAKRIATDLHKRRQAIAEGAQRRIRACGPDQIPPEELGARASAAIDDHRTVYVRIELRNGRVRATRGTRNGSTVSHEWSPARAASGLIVTGLADYIQENTNGIDPPDTDADRQWTGRRTGSDRIRNRFTRGRKTSGGPRRRRCAARPTEPHRCLPARAKGRGPRARQRQAQARGQRTRQAAAGRHAPRETPDLPAVEQLANRNQRRRGRCHDGQSIHVHQEDNNHCEAAL